MNAEYKLSLSVQYASNAKKLPTRSQFRRWVKAALEQDVVAGRLKVYGDAARADVGFPGP